MPSEQPTFKDTMVDWNDNSPRVFVSVDGVLTNTGNQAMLASGLREILESAKSNRNWYITDQARECLRLLGEVQQDDDLPPLTMSVYGTRTALELERQRRADIAARQDKQPAADAGGQAPAYGPDNPPRLRKQGESVEDYRVAMGWDAGNKVKQFEDDQKRSTFEFSQWIPGLDKPTTTSWDAWKAGREHLLAFQWKQAQQGEAKDVRQPAAGAVNQPLMPEPILWRVMWDDGEPGDGGFEDCASAKEAEEYAEDTRRHDWRNVRIVKLVDADAIARQPGQAAPCKS